MDYKKSLLELINSKKEISGSNSVELSLREIADAWGRKVINEKDLLGEKWEYISDQNFLESVANTIEKLQNEELINFDSITRDYRHSLADEKFGWKFESISDIKHLSSPQDEIVLEIKYKSKEEKFGEAKKYSWQNQEQDFLKDFRGENAIPQNKRYLESIHLITNSLEPTSVIFLVLDGHFEMPIRCAVKNSKEEPTYIKKLYDIAYIVNAPGKKVDYSRNLADNINNGLFKIKRVTEYMKTNKLKKPTLVQKSRENTLVLKNESVVKTELVHNISVQYRSLYIDKTR